MTLIYTKKYRSYEDSNWQLDERREREVTEEEWSKMTSKESCDLIGMRYVEKYNELHMMMPDRLHLLIVSIKKEDK